MFPEMEKHFKWTGVHSNTIVKDNMLDHLIVSPNRNNNLIIGPYEHGTENFCKCNSI